MSDDDGPLYWVSPIWTTEDRFLNELVYDKLRDDLGYHVVMTQKLTDEIDSNMSSVAGKGWPLYEFSDSQEFVNLYDELFQNRNLWFDDEIDRAKCDQIEVEISERLDQLTDEIRFYIDTEDLKLHIVKGNLPQNVTTMIENMLDKIKTNLETN